MNTNTKYKDKLLNLDKIKTHPGGGHRDDWTAVAIVLGLMKRHEMEMPVVFRQDPTNDDLESSSVMLIDVGLEWDEDLLNFDHHQFGRDEDPICALSLVLKWLGLYDTAKSVFKWLEATEIMDSKGPIVLGDAYDIGSNRLKSRMEQISSKYDVDKKYLSMEGTLPPRDAIMRMSSPIENFVLSTWSESECHSPGDPFYEFMVEFGLNTEETIAYIEHRHSELSDKGNVYDIGAVKVFDATFIPRDDNPTFYLEDYVSESHPDVAVTVTQDDRGEGFSLFRRNDHPAIDFSVFTERDVSGKQCIKDCWGDKIIFSHNGGFIAKTSELPRDDANELIKAAIVSDSPAV